jgi:phosphoglycerate dehydrogenase-like enzyme
MAKTVPAAAIPLTGDADRTIAGAGRDVYDEEPLPAGHPLRSAPRTVLTPHLGYVTDDSYRVFYGDAVEDIAACAAGRPVRGVDARWQHFLSIKLTFIRRRDVL